MKCNIQGISFSSIIRDKKETGRALTIRLTPETNTLHMDFCFPMVHSPVTLSFDAKTGKFKGILRGEKHIIARCLRNIHKEYLELLATIYLNHYEVLDEHVTSYKLPKQQGGGNFKLEYSPHAGRIRMEIATCGIQGAVLFDEDTCQIIQDEDIVTFANQREATAKLIKLLQADSHDYYPGLIAFAKRYIF